MGQLTPDAPPPPASRLRACAYCGRPRLASPERDYLYPCEGCGASASTLRPTGPPNRVIREGEPICRLCGSGYASHADGSRAHAYEGPLPFLVRVPEFLLFVVGPTLIALLVFALFGFIAYHACLEGVLCH